MSDYDDLAARAERGELTPIPGTIKQGQEAIDETRRLLMEVTGTATIEDARTIAVGRPSLSEKGGESPVVRARVAPATKVRLEEIAAAQNKNTSALIREVLESYALTH